MALSTEKTKGAILLTMTLMACLGKADTGAAADVAAPVVAITAPLAGTLVPLAGTTFTGTATDPSGVASVRIYVYDESRNVYTVSNVPAAYTAATGSWSFTVQPAYFTAGGFVRLWVQATDTAGNFSDWQLRRLQVAGSVVVADTTSPAVVITAPVGGSTVVSTGFVFSGTATDPSGVGSVRIYVYDESRNAYTVANALAAYNATSKVWTFSIAASHMTPLAFVRLWVRATDALGNSTDWLLSRVQVAGVAAPVDTTAPTVAIITPLAGTLVPLAGTTFTGTATDPSGVASVRIYVYDESRNVYTVSNVPAAYTAATGSWSFTVQPAYFTAGGFLRLWVQAADAAGNRSAWQERRVQVSVVVESLGPSLVRIQGMQMIVERRQLNGNLSSVRPFKLRGVAYSPVDAGETINTRADARQHLRESRFVEDFQLMEQLGANAIKVYVDAGTDATATAFLNEAYLRGLMVAVTLDIDSAETQSVVNAYKNHPALLCWLIGNEWNLNRFYRSLTIAQASAQVESFAQQVRALDANHPVGSSLGFLPGDFNMGRGILSREFPGIITSTPTVQFWGLNLYRGASFDPIFYEWKLIAAKPFMVTEFGTDDWDTDAGRLNEVAQAETDGALWDELHRHLSANNASRQCLGGFVFAWNDEWWKFGNPPLQDNGGYTIQQTVFRTGTATPIAVFRGHPDGVSNEEHYGLVTLNRQLKAAFTRMQSEFTLGTLRTDAVPLSVVSAATTTGYAAFHKRQLPVSAAEVPGFHLISLNRSTGTVDVMARFDVAANPLTECAALSTAVQAIPNGSVVLIGSARQAVPSGLTMAHASLASCASALGRLGSARALEITPQSSWALIAAFGPTSLNLAESFDAAGQPAVAAASILLDVDGDGLADSLDADNDNDGKSDVMERAWRTDLLDSILYY